MNFKTALDICRRIHHEYGTSYYWATRLFPREMREATHVLYAFFRVPDEIVDSKEGAQALIKRHQVARMTSGLSPQAAMRAWREAWQHSFSEPADDPVIAASRHIFKRFQIPERYANAFLQAMEQDLSQVHYQTYQELQDYMYGSAAVVGLMMTHVIGFSDSAALPYAEKLGYAMQLTNFLRDMREDLVERGRIYLPQDELHQFGLSDEDIQRQTVDDRFKEWMKFQISRADALYEEANRGIKYLHPRGRKGVKAGSDLYRMILRKIEEQEYDVFCKRARTSVFEKVRCIL